MKMVPEYWNIDYSLPSTSWGWVWLTFHYDPAALAAAGVLEQNLSVLHYNPITGDYERAQMVDRDTLADTITVRVDPLSLFALAEEPLEVLPEPASAMLVLLGMGALAVIRRRR